MDIVGVRISNKAAGTRNYRRTVEYPDKSDPNEVNEKILFPATFLNTQSNITMVFHAERATQLSRSKNPLEHFVISFARHLKPSQEQCAIVVKNVLNEIGCNDCPSKWVVHGNTHCVHIHLVVVRALKNDPSKIIAPAFIIQNLHRGIAKSTFDLGLEFSENSPIFYDGAKFYTHTSSQKKYSRAARSYEVRSKEHSTLANAEHLLKDLISNVTRNAENWSWARFEEQVHEIGFEVERAKGGLIFASRSSGVRIKGSLLRFSRKTAEKILGPMPDSIRHVSDKKSTTDLNESHRSKFRIDDSTEKTEVQLKQELHETLLAGKKLFNSINESSQIKLDDAFELLKIQSERKEILKQLGSKRTTKDSFPVLCVDEFSKKADVSIHQKEEVDKALIALDQRKETFYYLESDRHSGLMNAPELSAFSSRRCSLGVEYFSDTLDPAFLDCGPRIVGYAARSELAIAASLQLASLKWPGGFNISGSPEVQQRLIETAISLDLGGLIKNPELQQTILLVQESRSKSLKLAELQSAMTIAKSLSRSKSPPVPPLVKGLTDAEIRHKEDLLRYRPITDENRLPRLPSSHVVGAAPEQSRFRRYTARQHFLPGVEPRHDKSTSAVFGENGATSIIGSNGVEQVSRALGVEAFRVSALKRMRGFGDNTCDGILVFGQLDRNGYSTPFPKSKLVDELVLNHGNWQSQQLQGVRIQPVSQKHVYISLNGLSYESVKKMNDDGFRHTLLLKTGLDQFQISFRSPTNPDFACRRLDLNVRQFVEELAKKYGGNATDWLSLPGHSGPKTLLNNHCNKTILVDALGRDCPLCTRVISDMNKTVPASQIHVPNPDGTSAVNVALRHFQQRFQEAAWTQKAADRECMVRLLSMGFADPEIISALIQFKSTQAEVADQDASYHLKIDHQRYAEGVLSDVKKHCTELISEFSTSYARLWLKEISANKAGARQLPSFGI